VVKDFGVSAFLLAFLFVGKPPFKPFGFYKASAQGQSSDIVNFI
jgi:hypothetical protein